MLVQYIFSPFLNKFGIEYSGLYSPGIFFANFSATFTVCWKTLNIEAHKSTGQIVSSKYSTWGTTQQYDWYQDMSDDISID